MLGVHDPKVQAYVSCLYFLSVCSLFGFYENDANQPGQSSFDYLLLFIIIIIYYYVFFRTSI